MTTAPDFLWTRIRSWHLVPRGSWSTLCGRESISRVQLEEYPANEATCNTCLNIAERRANKARHLEVASE